MAQTPGQCCHCPEHETTRSHSRQFASSSEGCSYYVIRAKLRKVTANFLFGVVPLEENSRFRPRSKTAFKKKAFEEENESCALSAYSQANRHEPKWAVLKGRGERFGEHDHLVGKCRAGKARGQQRNLGGYQQRGRRRNKCGEGCCRRGGSEGTREVVTALRHPHSCGRDVVGGPLTGTRRRS